MIEREERGNAELKGRIAKGFQEMRNLITVQLDLLAQFESIVPEKAVEVSALKRLCQQGIEACDRGDYPAVARCHEALSARCQKLRSELTKRPASWSWINSGGKPIPWPDHPVYFGALSPEQQAEGLKAARAKLRKTLPFLEAMMNDEQLVAELADLDLRQVVIAPLEDDGRRHDC